MIEFISAISAAGLNPPGEIEPGQFIRFPGSGKNGSNKAGWAYLFPDYLGGVFGDYSTGLSEKWRSGKVDTLSPSERAEFERSIKEQQETAQIIREVDYMAAGYVAREKWEAASPANDLHPYLVSKQVKAYGLRQADGNLIIPLYASTGHLTTIQTIEPDGAKKLLKSGRKKGSAFLIPGDTSKLFIVEGYATGASVHEVTGCAVLVAVDAGNLRHVINKLNFSRYGAVIIAADNDHEKESNTGIDAAEAIVKEFPNVQIVAPPAIKGSQATDWNDYVVKHGKGKAKDLLFDRPRILAAHEIEHGNLTTRFPDEILNHPIIALGLEAATELSALSIIPYNLVSVLTHIATAIAGKIQCDGVHPSIFAVRVGPTSTGKTHTDKGFKNYFESHFLREDGNELIDTFYGPTDFASGPGLMQAAKRQPFCLAMVDEVTGLIANGMKNKGDSLSQQKVDAILVLSTSAGSRIKKMYADAKNEIIVNRPVINLTGNATPLIFKSFSIDDTYNGLIQRLDFFCYDGPILRWKRKVLDGRKPFTPHAEKFLEVIKNLHDTAKPEGRVDLIKHDAINIGFEPDAYNLLADESDECVDLQNLETDEGKRGIMGRIHQAAIRWALVFHAVNPETLFNPLTVKDIKLGLMMAKTMAEWKLTVLMDNLSSGDFHSNCEMFVEAIQAALKANLKPTWNVLISRRIKLKNIQPRDRDAIITALKEAGRIVIENDGKAPKYQLLSE